MEGRMQRNTPAIPARVRLRSDDVVEFETEHDVFPARSYVRNNLPTLLDHLAWQLCYS